MISLLSPKHLSIISILTFFSIFWFLYNGFIRPKDPNQSHLMGHCVLDIPKSSKKFFPIMAKRFKYVFSFEDCLDMWSLSHFLSINDNITVYSIPFLVLLLFLLVCVRKREWI